MGNFRCEIISQLFKRKKAGVGKYFADGMAQKISRLAAHAKPLTSQRTFRAGARGAQRKRLTQRCKDAIARKMQVEIPGTFDSNTQTPGTSQVPVVFRRCLVFFNAGLDAGGKETFRY